jgi:hypothetical protein
MSQGNVRSQYQGLNQREDEDQTMSQGNVRSQYRYPPSGFATDIDFLRYLGPLSGLHPPSGLAPDIDFLRYLVLLSGLHPPSGLAPDIDFLIRGKTRGRMKTRQ